MEFAPNLVDAAVDPCEWARRREDEGWPVIAAADHLWDTSRAYAHWAVQLTSFALSTTRPRITSSFANNLLRSPVEFAQAALALQRASSGRFEAGLGAGWSRAEIADIGLHYPSPGERAGRYAEAIQIARSLLHERRCSFAGEHYAVDVPMLAPAVEPPPLVASVGGPRTIRTVVPHVDRVELKVTSPATRAGALDLSTLATVTVDDLRRLVGLVRSVRDDVPIGMFLMVGCGDHPRLDGLRTMLSGSWMGSFVGDPAAVADRLRALADEGISRVQLTPYTPDTIELLAPHLAADV